MTGPVPVPLFSGIQWDHIRHMGDRQSSIRVHWMAVLQCMAKNIDNNNQCAHPSTAFKCATNKIVLFECEND